MLKPNSKTYRKYNKGRNITQKELKACALKFGTHGIQALEKGRISAHQIESVRRTITNFLKRHGKLWIRIFPDYPITKKPNEVRMGKGKGNVAFWVCNVKPGRILYELTGTNFRLLSAALEYASLKLPIAHKIITREFLEK